MGLKVWLPLNGTFENKGTSGATVTNYGATVNDSGKIGKCYSFDGSNDAISIGNLSTIVDTDFSFSCWFYHDNTWSSKRWETIFGGPSGFELEAKEGNTNSPVIRAYSWGNGTITYELNKWNHLAMTRNSTETKFYLNGELKLTGSRGSIPSGNYFIGSWRDSTSQNFKGKFNDVRLYDHALSAKEVKELSQALILHYPLDDISEGYDRLDYITFAGYQYFFIDKPAGQKSNMRIEMGIQPDTLSHSQPTFFSGRDSGVQFYRYSSSPITRLALWTNNGSHVIGTFTSGKINSLVIEMTTSSVKTNLNGSVVTSSNTNAFNKLFSSTCTKFTVGGYSTGSYLFYGNMSYLNLYVDGELIFLGIPYKRKTDNVAGMYDLVTNQFFTSNGSQNFVAGNAMPGLSNRICDCSGLGNNGTITGTLSLDTNTPRYQNSTSFNGTSYIQVESPSTEVRTITFWAKWNSIPSGQSVVFVDQKSKIGFGIMQTGLLLL